MAHVAGATLHGAQVLGRAQFWKQAGFAVGSEVGCGHNRILEAGSGDWFWACIQHPPERGQAGARVRSREKKAGIVLELALRWFLQNR